MKALSVLQKKGCQGAEGALRARRPLTLASIWLCQCERIAGTARSMGVEVI